VRDLPTGHHGHGPTVPMMGPPQRDKKTEKFIPKKVKTLLLYLITRVTTFLYPIYLRTYVPTFMQFTATFSTTIIIVPMGLHKGKSRIGYMRLGPMVRAW